MLGIRSVFSQGPSKLHPHKATMALPQDAQSLQGASEQSHLLTTHDHQWASPLTTRRSSPAWPSSWTPSCTCCLWILTRALSAQHTSLSLAREGASVVLPLQLANPKSEFIWEARSLRPRRLAQALGLEPLAGRPWLWAVLETARLKRGAVIPWSAGGRRGSVRARGVHGH